MSKIVKSWDSRGIGNIVQTDDGNAYLVDSCFTYDHGLETMVFEYDLEADDVRSWMDLYAEWYDSVEEMRKHHEEVCRNLEKYLDGGIQEDEELEGVLVE